MQIERQNIGEEKGRRRFKEEKEKEREGTKPLGC